MAGFTLPPEVVVEPLGDMMLNFLIDRDKEDAFIDFIEHTLGSKRYRHII